MNFNLIRFSFLLLLCYTSKVIGFARDTSEIANFDAPSEWKRQQEKSRLKVDDYSHYVVRQLDNTKGLSNSSINTIFQDSENFLWIGTWDGLNRYDGKNFKIFRLESDNENSISNQVVLKIEEDKKGAIWVLTMHGINRYDKSTDTFQRFYFSRKENPPSSELEYNMAIDSLGNVYCAVRDWGLGYFHNNEFHRLSHYNLPDEAIIKMDFVSSGQLLLLLGDNTLRLLEIESDDMATRSVQSQRIVARDVQTFGKCFNQNYYVLSTSGKTQFLSSFVEDAENIIHEAGSQSVIGYTSDGLLLSGRTEYYLLDSLGNEVEKTWLGYLNDQKVTTLLEGSEDILWVGTDGDGLLVIHPSKKLFNPITKSQIPELRGGIVRAFCEIDTQSFWVGTKGKGIFRFSSSFYQDDYNKTLKYDNLDESNSPINKSVYSIYKGEEDLIYIGTDGVGVTIYDTSTLKFVTWNEIAGTENCKFFKSVYTIYQDENGFVWLGTNGYGMIRFRLEKREQQLQVANFKQYLAGSLEEGSLSSNIIFSIVPDSANSLWVGTRLGGLNHFNKISETFKTYKNSRENPKSLSSNDILCMHVGADKKLWVGTSNGLSSLEYLDEENKPVFQNFSATDGLPNNTIHGIVSDSESNLWISTNLGLSNFLLKEGRFINFTENEGLQNNEFADGAYYQSSFSEYFFMGGIKGFNYFLPSEIKQSSQMPDVFIEKISGQNETSAYFQNRVISPDSYSKSSIVLNHNQNFFDIELAVMSFVNNEKCQFAYKLENFNSNWDNIGNRRNISFTNVPPGVYTLWLKWSNSDGVWSQPVQAVDIRVKPIFWQSNLAKVIYLILFLLLLWLVHSYYRKRQLLKQNIIFQEREEEIHQNKLTFFTNIAHELQTPLTLIVGPSQKLADSKSFRGEHRKFINMIQRNASRLLFLTQQLLEFRKAEFDHLEVSVRQFDLLGLLEQITELFDELALQNKIQFKLNAPSQLMGWYDKDKIEKIVFNLLSNAFKYTPENGVIEFEIAFLGEEKKQLKMSISNSGVGIPAEKLDLVFERFTLSNEVDDSSNDKFRTGIGLAFVKRLVTVLKGVVTVSSTPNELTVFTIILPCDKQSFGEDEINQEKKHAIISHYLKNILGQDSVNLNNELPEKIAIIDSVFDKRKVVLIVEDEKEIQLLLSDILCEKYKILVANNGAEAIDLVRKENPDVIVSDIMMPVMDGIELCKKIKKDINTCHIPFIMLTSKTSMAHRVEGFESGANSYISKPFYPDHLLARIQNLIDEKESIIKFFTQETFDDDLQSLPINRDEKVFLKKVIEIIRNNIDRESLQSLLIEKEMGMSSSQLYRRIKQASGFSPGDLIRTTRLKYAAELLQKNELTVSEICYQAGFNNRSYFYREFKKMYKITPKNYQLKYQTRFTV